MRLRDLTLMAGLALGVATGLAGCSREEGAAVDAAKDAAEATKDAGAAAVDATKEAGHDAAVATGDAAEAVEKKLE